MMNEVKMNTTKLTTRKFKINRRVILSAQKS